MSNGSDMIKLKGIVLKYGLTLRRAQPLDSLYKRAAAYRVVTDQGPYVVKPFYGRTGNKRLTSKQQIVRVSAYVRQLQEAAYPHMPKWLLTRSGRYSVSRQGRPYYMTEWIEGRWLVAEEQDYLRLGRALASLHSLNGDGTVAKSRATMKLIHAFNRRHTLFRRRLTKLKHDKRGGYWFKRHGHECLTLYQEAAAILRKPSVMRILAEEKNRPATLIHGDVTLPNVIVQSDTLFLIDWDLVCIGSAYYEVAKTLANVSQFNPSLMHALLTGYEEVKPLLPEERALIRALFGIPREAWIAAHHLALNRKGTTLRLLKQAWDARLNAIRWLDQWANLNA